MRRPLAVFAFLTLASCGSDPVEPPRIAFDLTVADVGTVDPGSGFETEFAFDNRGGTDLVIDSVSTACDCRAQVVPSEVLLPGKRGSIRLSCDARDLAGPQTRTATVYSSDSANPIVALTLRADVAAPIAAEPKEIYFGKVRRGEQSRRRLRLAGRSDEAAAVLSYHGSVFRMTSAIDSKSSQGGTAEAQLDFTVLSAAPLGRFREEIEISSEAGSSVTVPVVGVVEGDLRTSPPRLVFGGDVEGSRELLLQNGGPTPIAAPVVVRRPEWTAVEIEELTPGFDYRVVARLRPPLSHGRVEGVIELATTHSEQPSVSIPVVATGKGRE